MASIAKKPIVEEEPESELENDEDEDDDDEDEDGDEEDDDEEESDELTPADVAIDVAKAISEAHEGCANAVAEKGRVLLDLEDESRWVLIVKARD